MAYTRRICMDVADYWKFPPHVREDLEKVLNESPHAQKHEDETFEAAVLDFFFELHPSYRRHFDGSLFIEALTERGIRFNMPP